MDEHNASSDQSSHLRAGFSDSEVARIGAPVLDPIQTPTGATPAAVVDPKVPTVRLEKKHPLAIRWMHWMNFPLVTTMIWSGWLIYWNDSIPLVGQAHHVYRIGWGKFTLFRFFPEWFYTAIHAHYNVTKGLGFHFFFMWLFIGNGILYVLYTLISGEWRFLFPSRHSFKEAIHVTLHDLGIRKDAPPTRKFNGAQQIAYTSVILMGAGSFLTGLAIYKPTQLHLLTTLLGGYEVARLLHFWLTVGYCTFFVVHIAQVTRAGWNNLRAMISGYELRPAAEPAYTPDRS